MKKNDAVSKAEVLEVYADLYEVFENNKGIINELNKVFNKINSLPSAQPDVPDTDVGDMISRQAAIDHFRSIIDATGTAEKYNEGFVDGLEFSVAHLSTMPSAQPDIYWGYTVTYERPLADSEIVSRLRSIQMQVGGSYAIDRAIEIIEAVAEWSAE